MRDRDDERDGTETTTKHEFESQQTRSCRDRSVLDPSVDVVDSMVGVLWYVC